MSCQTADGQLEDMLDSQARRSPTAAMKQMKSGLQKVPVSQLAGRWLSPLRHPALWLARSRRPTAKSWDGC